MSRREDEGGRERLIVGVGNPLRGDDGVGFRAADMLQDHIGPGTRVVKCAGESLSLLESWKDASVVLLIDAVRSGSPPGTLHRRDLGRDPLGLEGFTFSTHALSLPETLALARVLGRLPSRVLFHGIEAATMEFGEGLSPLVERALPELVDAVLGDLERTRPVGTG